MTVKTADAIRAALICPRCKQRGTIRARRERHELAGGIALRLICDGERVDAKRCGVLGDFTPPDPHAWNVAAPDEAVAVLQRFLDAAEAPQEAVDALAFAQRKNDRIDALEAEIAQMAEMVHQAYHGGGAHDREVDPCDCDWGECPRGICQRAQRALGIEVENGRG